MNNIIKVILIAILCLIAIGVIVAIIWLNNVFPPPVSKATIQKEFYKNNKEILLVTEFLKNSQYNNIYISDTAELGTMSIKDGEKSIINKIDDVNVINAVDYLFKSCGFGIIDKNNNTIIFQRWTALADRSRGIAYSLDSSEPKVEFLTKFETLPEKNWFYYETDFNEWKKRNGN